MKIKHIFLFSMLLPLSVVAGDFVSHSNFATNKYVYVSGTRVTLDHTSFTKYDDIESYFALVRVDGDAGQSLVFDVDAKVKGNGFYDVKEDCIRLDPIGEPVYPDPMSNWQPMGTRRVCTASDYPKNKFFFTVRLNVTCNEHVVGTYTGNKNALLSPAELKAAKGGVDPITGKPIENPYNTERNINLLVDAEINTGGACKELRVELEGLQGTKISDITTDILIAESF